MKAFAVLCSLYLCIARASEWSYHDTHSWPALCLEGVQQSPINFEAHSLHSNCLIPELDIDSDSLPSSLSIKNNGHTLQVDIPEGEVIRLKGGGLPGTYVLKQFHFHWGHEHHIGSEHTLGGLHYPLEVHFVHVKEGMDIPTALKTDQSIAVLGVFFRLKEKGNEGLESLRPYINNVSKIVHNGSVTEVTPFKPYSLLPHDKSTFYRYEGSLTTPGCQQVVVWTVLSQPAEATAEQLDMFRHVHDHHDVHVKHNYRHTLPLNDRTVTMRTKHCPNTATTMVGALCTILLCCLCSILHLI